MKMIQVLMIIIEEEDLSFTNVLTMDMVDARGEIAMVTLGIADTN